MLAAWFAATVGGIAGAALVHTAVRNGWDPDPVFRALPGTQNGDIPRVRAAIADDPARAFALGAISGVPLKSRRRGGPGRAHPAAHPVVGGDQPRTTHRCLSPGCWGAREGDASRRPRFLGHRRHLCAGLGRLLCLVLDRAPRPGRERRLAVHEALSLSDISAAVEATLETGTAMFSSRVRVSGVPDIPDDTVRADVSGQISFGPEWRWRMIMQMVSYPGSAEIATKSG